MLKQRNLITVFLLLISFSLFAQEKKQITLEDIWLKGTFRPQYMEGFRWMANDQYYSSIEENNIVRSDVATGNVTSTIYNNSENIEIDDYEFSKDEAKILLLSEMEQIYRHSFTAIYHVYDIKSKSLKKVSPNKISYATFSPDRKNIAYVFENNLYYLNTENSETTKVTDSGKINSIINGSTDWVYEEEFSFTKAFFWSADSKKIAFYTFDESQVKEYNLQIWDGLYPTDYKYKYPKAGEKNSEVSVNCYFLETKQTEKINTGNEKDIYIPRIKWTNDANTLAIFKLNRLQNDLEIIHADVATSNSQVAYREKNDTYVEINDDLTYLKDGKHFILTSERDGYRHIYKYDMSGKLISQVTQGKWEVDKFLGIDEKKDLVYYTSTEVSPLERHLYFINSSGQKKKKLTESKGTHDIEISSGFRFFIDNVSTLNEPPVAWLRNLKDGKQLKTLIHNKDLKNKMDEFQMSKAEFFQFITADKVTLNAYMIKPLNFDAGKQYPVMIFVYGGPGSQSVNDSWSGGNYFWFQYLAQQGYIIVSIDNRGTGGRGSEFKKMTQNQLGKYESEDVIHTAKYLGAQQYIDKSKIGIFGWSYGGYLSSLAITLGADYFKAAIAVAPVTSWRFYDTIYTERFLGLPQQNAAGYDEFSPLSHASMLKGSYLLVHGTADDNVHLQNSYAMQDALIKANKQFDVFYYPDKNHGIYGGNTRFHLYKMMSDFIFKNL
jgi:dipeptidyl-peptidase 4